MYRYFIHDASGKVTHTGTCQDPRHISPPPGHDYILLEEDQDVPCCGSIYTPQADGPPIYSDPPVIVPLDPLVGMRVACITTMRSACALRILQGFTNGPRYYPSSMVDQHNMVVVAHVGGVLRCKENGLWSLLDHTPEAGRSVLESFVAMRDNARRQLDERTTQINEASTKDEIRNIRWDHD